MSGFVRGYHIDVVNRENISKISKLTMGREGYYLYSDF